METPRDKAGLLARIERSWAALDGMVGAASEARLTAAGPDGGWSVKDHLAHLSAWEGRLLAFLEGRGLAEHFGLDGATLRDLGTDGLNARLTERDRGRPLADVLAGWRETHRRVLAALERAELTEPVPDPDDPGDREPLLGSGVLDGNTYEHYEEHGEAIRRLLG
ncbi:MAG TPA: maleylpyruvate isomerase N-terminal domain-containing protein [Chloroflexota bacterium]|jgi:hypothetical protein|nr:maleylpyruvate isomerase N-terminal domain-containing protein [Chloroflexota bacterium]